MPYGITQCYLPLGSGDFTAAISADLATPDGCKAELIWQKVCIGKAMTLIGGTGSGITTL